MKSLINLHNKIVEKNLVNPLLVDNNNIIYKSIHKIVRNMSKMNKIIPMCGRKGLLTITNSIKCVKNSTTSN